MQDMSVYASQADASSRRDQGAAPLGTGVASAVAVMSPLLRVPEEAAGQHFWAWWRGMATCREAPRQLLTRRMLKI